MNLPRPRFTTRRLMIVVVFAAFLLGAERTRRRSSHFGALARSIAQQEEFDRLILDGGTAIIRGADGRVREIHGGSEFIVKEGNGTITYTTDPSPGYETDRLRQRVERRALLRRKYERAALPLAPRPARPARVEVGRVETQPTGLCANRGISFRSRHHCPCTTLIVLPLLSVDS